MSDPLRGSSSRRGAIGLLTLIVLYKLGDAFAGALSTTFLLRRRLHPDGSRHGQ